MSVAVQKAIETDAKLNSIMKKLKQEQDLGNHVSADLYSHLTEVFSRIIQYHHYDAFEKFEEISILVKQTNFTVKDPVRDVELSNKISKNYGQITNSQAIKAIERAKALLAEKIEADSQDKKLLSKDKVVIPNLAKEAAMLRWAGIDFGQA